jgi:hypothetical protein
LVPVLDLILTVSGLIFDPQYCLESKIDNKYLKFLNKANKMFFICRVKLCAFHAELGKFCYRSDQVI